MPRVEAVIDLQALVSNFSFIQNLVGRRVRIMPMIKANAYGHGLLEVAMQLPNANAFGVAALLEAVSLREAGITQPLYVMCGFCHADEIALFVEHDLTAIIHHPDQIVWLEKTTLKRPLNIWLKLDTGMHRLGVSIAEFTDCYQRLLKSDNVAKPFGVMSHLACAGSDERVTRQQLDYFTKATLYHTGFKSLANSAATLRYPNMYFDLVRPGIMLYGVSPFVGQTGEQLSLTPVMTLKSHLLSYKSLCRGERVGYDLTWRAEHDMSIGIVAAGYGDGYPWHAQPGTPVLIGGQKCPLVGRVSMDMLAVDLSMVKRAQIGDEVILWGSGLPIEGIASSSKTISYELLCKLTRRVQRHVFVATTDVQKDNIML